MLKIGQTYDWACLYATVLNWPIHPLHSSYNGRCTCYKEACANVGKHPRSKAGFKDATIDMTIIETWFEEYNYFNIGTRTGSASNLFVLDIDKGHGGEESLAVLCAKHEPLSETVEVISGGGGRHLYYQLPEGVEIRSSAGKLGPGIDVRAEGGYIVAPPSIHKSGNRYCWKPGHEPHLNPIQPVPEWIITLLTETNTTNLKGGTFLERLLAGAIGEGNRNNTITSVAGNLLARKVDAEFTLYLCSLINKDICTPPLEEEEIFRTVNSICGREIQKLNKPKTP